MGYRLVDRYIGRHIFYSTLLVLAMLLAIFSFFLLIDAMGDFGKGAFGFYALARYVVLSLPARIYELFPAAALLGTAVGLSVLALNAELTALRAAGVSVLAIVRAVMKTAVIFIVAGVVLGEWVVPTTEDLAQRGRAEALQQGFRQQRTGLWLKDGHAIVDIGEVLPDNSLLRVTIYRLDGDSGLREHLSAARAFYRHGHWRLQDVRETWFGPQGVRMRREASMPWETSITPEMVGIFAVNPGSLSSWQLYRYIEHLRQNHEDTARYELALWTKLLQPLATAIMVLLGVPFVFGQARSGGLGQRIFWGVMLGFGFVVFTRGVGYFSLVYGLPPLAGAAVPLALFLALALYLLYRVA